MNADNDFDSCLMPTVLKCLKWIVDGIMPSVPVRMVYSCSTGIVISICAIKQEYTAENNNSKNKSNTFNTRRVVYTSLAWKTARSTNFCLQTKVSKGLCLDMFQIFDTISWIPLKRKREIC